MRGCNDLVEAIYAAQRNRREDSGVITLSQNKPKRPSVLVVDDEPFLRDSVKRILETKNFIVFTASDGTELVDIISKFPIDLILLDVHLPWINGIELCSMLKNPKYDVGHIPIVFLSGNREKETMKEAFDVGCDDYLIKPVDPLYLLNTVKTLIKISDFPELNFK